jgi:hypothetical protein
LPQHATIAQLKVYVDAQAVKMGISPALVNCIVGAESQWITNKVGPEKKGSSQGLFQIYNLAHPSITQAEAFDPVFATQWSLKQIAAGSVRIWTTYGRYCRSIPVFIPTK